jgi:hypothetical protein
MVIAAGGQTKMNTGRLPIHAQKTTFARENLLNMQKAICVEEEVGAGLGAGEILQ